MTKTHSSENNFVLTCIPYTRYIAARIGVVATGGLLIWELSAWILGRSRSATIFILTVAIVFVVSLVRIALTSTTKITINRVYREVYFIRMLGLIRKVRTIDFDEISEGLYVQEDENPYDDRPKFVYSLLLRLKFEEDILVGAKSNSEWKVYTDAAHEANKYLVD